MKFAIHCSSSGNCISFTNFPSRKLHHYRIIGHSINQFIQNLHISFLCCKKFRRNSQSIIKPIVEFTNKIIVKFFLILVSVIKCDWLNFAFLIMSNTVSPTNPMVKIRYFAVLLMACSILPSFF